MHRRRRLLQGCREGCDGDTSHEPSGRFWESCFNFVAVATVSEDEGVSVPRKKEWKKTSFGSNFDTFYSDRYLTTGNVSDIHESVSHVPYEHIIVLANCDVYGGGGIYNSYTLTTTDIIISRRWSYMSSDIVSGGLADEYFYEGDVMEDSYPLMWSLGSRILPHSWILIQNGNPCLRKGLRCRHNAVNGNGILWVCSREEDIRFVVYTALRTGAVCVTMNGMDSAPRAAVPSTL